MPRSFRLLPALVCLLASTAVGVAVEKDFVLAGATVTLEDSTDKVAVFFSSMRFNRAANIWNVEVSLSNRTAQALSGPVVLLVDDFTGTTGALQPDGRDENAKPFYDLTSVTSEGRLVPATPSRTRTLSLGATNTAPRLTTRVFTLAAGTNRALALGLTRTLDEVGQPLVGVQVIESGPTGTRTNRTDPVFGVVTLGPASGSNVWVFSAPGRLPVWRQQALATNEVAIIPNPRLVPRGSNSIVLTAIAGGTLSNENGTIRIAFAPGSVQQDSTATLTPLSGQTLPALLPLGWSPLQSFWVEFAKEPVSAGTAQLTLFAALADGEKAALVRWDPAALQWDILQVIAGNGTASATVSLLGSGAYVVVVGDSAPTAPPEAKVGERLSGTIAGAINTASLTASGTVNPNLSPASRFPGLVTATATLVVSNSAAPLPSGLLLRAEIHENYQLRDATSRRPPQYENFVFAYQHPGDGDPTTLAASFPLQPLLLFGAEELDQATVRMDLLNPAPFAGSVLETNGGLIVSAGVRILAGTADFTKPEAAQLRTLAPTNFVDLAPTNVAQVLTAFELTVPSLAASKHLDAQIDQLPANSIFVLGRVLYDEGLYGVLPVERLTSDAAGRLTSSEPLSGERLPGIVSAGQYGFLRVEAPQGIVTGVAHNSTGQPAGGMPVRIKGQPWLAFSDQNGAFRLLAPAGEAEVSVTDLVSGNAGTTIVAVPNPQVPVSATVAAIAVGPEVVSVNPTNAAKNVSRVTSVEVTFSKPINPGVLANGGLRLLDPTGVQVQGALSLNLKNTVATLLPSNPLAPSTVWTIELSTNITDAAGMPLQGPARFTFTTETDALARGAAQLIIYEPTNGLAPVFGGPGAADPESPVILVNETSGQTATILSRTDGSFTNSIAASEEDFISAVLVNRNGTRSTLPASRQIFRDGSVGLFNGGGVIEIQSEDGRVQVTVAPGMIQTRSKFKLELVSTNELLSMLDNVTPTNALLAGNGLRLRVEGDRMKSGTGGLDLSFPMTAQRLRSLGLETNADPRKATYLLAVPTKVEGDPTYCIVDSMQYENGQVVTHSPPFPGAELFIVPPKLPQNPTDPVEDDVSQAFERAVQGIELVGIIADLPAAAAQSILTIPLVCLEKSFPVKFTGRVIQLELADVPLQLPNGGTTNVVAPRRARALAGAFVTARSLSLGLSAARPGRLDPGAMYCLSRQNGSFALALPAPEFSTDPRANTDFLLTATHPRFPGTRVVELAAPPQATVSLNDLVFTVNVTHSNDPRPPAILVSHDPEFPAPAISNTANLHVLATHSSGPPTIGVRIESVRSLIPNVTATILDAGMGTAQLQSAGATGTRELLPIGCRKAARVTLVVTATAGGGQHDEVRYQIDFGGSEPPSTNPPAADLQDLQHPRVISTTPQEGARAVALGEPIQIRFNEAIKNSVLQASAFTISPAAGSPRLDLSPDQQELTAIFSQLKPDTDYTLEVSSQVHDLANNTLDQVPSTTNQFESFLLHFHTAPATPVPLPGLASGGGSVICGIYAYALERAGPLDGALVVYDLSDPASPAKVSGAELSVPGFPRDLVLIPNYAYKLTPGGSAATNNLLAVVGGKTGGSPDSSGVLLGGFQYLWVVDISDPQHPKRIASAAIVLSPQTTVSKIKWSPPALTYLEASGELTSVGLVDLQSFILGGNMSPQDYAQFPLGRAGNDANHDGDYVDPNDVLPLPARSPDQFAGWAGAFLVDDTSQRIIDFDWEPLTATLGVVLGQGLLLDAQNLPNGPPVAPCYRTLLSGGLELTRTNASLTLTNQTPKRVSLLPGVPLQIAGQTRVFNLALVAVEPSGSNPSQLAVIDISDPTAPHLLQAINIDPQHGVAQSVIQRDDGQLRLATTRDVLLLDAFRLNEAGPTNGPHPAIIGVLPDLGSGARSFGALAAGLNTVALGGKNLFAQTAPSLTFVRLDNGPLFKPADIIDKPVIVESNLANLKPTSFLLPSRFQTVPGIAQSTLIPPAKEVHYYVRVDAPGSAGESIDVALESLNAAGYPLRNRGEGFPPVRSAASNTVARLQQTPRTCDASIRALTAYRLSSTKGDPNYNVYLSRPFALSYEAMSDTDLQQMRSLFDREILWTGAFMRATLDPDQETNAVLKAFAGRVGTNELVIQPGAMAIAEALEGDYIMGPNPPPVGGHADVPGTFGTVAAHNGEFRMDTVDFTLPGRRMPIQFERHYGGQDLHFGAFGRGWDFNYNQRLVELKSAVVPAGMRIPLVIRGNGTDEIGASRDILFHPGDGRVLLFTFASNSPPAGYQQDPLIKDLKWDTAGVGFYLPPEGVFDLLVRFGDGHFARLTPEGTRYWYSRNGRLEKIQDRYTPNVIELEYNTRGQLRRIIDRTAPERWLELGYYRNSTDVEAGFPDKAAPASSPAIIGNVCALRDHLGSATQRDVLFEYDDCGKLVQRFGIEVMKHNQDGFQHREITTYHQTSDPRFTLANGGIGVSEGSQTGGALFTGKTFDSSGSAPELKTGTGANGDYNIDVQHQNTAQAIAAGTGKTVIEAPDKSTAEFSFNSEGRPASVVLKGARAADAPTRFEYERGLVKKVTYPEGNSVTYGYDTNNPNIRAHGDLRSITRTPDPNRGGPSIPTASFSPCDQRYHFPVNTFTDFNSQQINYQPTADGLDVGKTIYPVAGTVEKRYNQFGQIAFERSIEGFETSYTLYNSDGFLERKLNGSLPTTYTYLGVSGARGLPETVTPPEGAAYSLDYNERDELITLSRGTRYFEKRSHDVNGYIARRETSVAAGVSLVETAQYLQNGFRTNVTWQQIETDGSIQDLSMSFTPDAAFRMTEITYPGNQVRRYKNFDHLGRPLRMELDSYSEDYTFDLNGNPLSIKRGTATEEFVYDGYDRLVTTKLQSGGGTEETTREYHGTGELKHLTIKDAGGNVNLDEDYDIDTYGRVTAVTAATDGGPSFTQYLYDQGALTSTIVTPAPASEHQVTTYNTAGQVVKREDSTGTTVMDYQAGTELKTTTATESGHSFAKDFQPYNELNQSEKISDGEGTVADLVPRIDGQLESMADGVGNATHFSYTKLGEELTRTRDNGIEFHTSYRPHRARGHVGDKTGAGHELTFDDAFRLKTLTLRKPQSAIDVRSFDLRGNMAQAVQIPGGDITYGRDEQGRMTSCTVNFGLSPRSETWKYDALDRVTSGTFPDGSAALGYDKLGPLTSTTLTLHGKDYQVAATVRGDRARLSVTYPKGDNAPDLKVTEDRDPAGRLTSLRPASGDVILDQTLFAGADLEGEETFGGNLIKSISTFDGRKRLTGRSYKRSSSGATLAEVRYAYDGANNLVARQYLHRAGRAELFSYDTGNRLATANFGTRPLFTDAAPRLYPGFTVPPGVPGTWAPGYYTRSYGYSTNGLDTFVGISETNPDGVTGQLFAQTYSGGDDFLNVQTIDGVSRGSDLLGNTTHARLLVRKPSAPLIIAQGATLEYNGLSQLTTVTRDDGVVIRYEYQHDGLLCYRTIDDPSLPGGKQETAFVWHEGLLLAEFERTVTANILRARYYYGSSDVPVAADIADSAGTLQRYYLLREGDGSVMGLVDASGQLVERYYYDAWGQPEIQGPDTAAPRIRRVVSDGNALLVEFSERVLPPLQSVPPVGLANQYAGLAGSLALSTNGVLAPGNTILSEQAVGFAFGTVLRFVPTTPLSGACRLSLSGSTLQDEAGNLNSGQAVDFTFDPTPGAVLLVATNQPSTAPSARVRTVVGSPFLFHGQWFDYDAGLYYMRARFYEPYSGLFLQPDPDAYEDSPNLYAAFGNNPTSYRDPTGTLRLPSISGSLGRLLVRAGKALTRISPKALRPVGKFLRRSGEYVASGTRAAERLQLRKFEKGFFAESRFARYWEVGATRAKMEFPKNNPNVFKDYVRNSDHILLNARDGFHFNARLDEDGMVDIEVMLRDPKTGNRSVHANVLGSGRKNYQRMFAEWGDQIRGWKGLLVEDNFDAVHAALPANYTQAQLNDAIINCSISGKFWKQWARAKGLNIDVVDAYMNGTSYIDFMVKFTPK